MATPKNIKQTSPFPAGKYYTSFADYLQTRFGEKVYKVTIDAGFTCPNRDGTFSDKGCIFCDEGGSFSRAHDTLLSPFEQLCTGMDSQHKRFGANKFIAYLQAYTNTYAPPDYLKCLYDSITDHPDVVGLSIGTRPDCVNEEKIDLIASYANENRDVWIEYGMQSMHDISLKKINRGESHDDFLLAMSWTRNTPIKTCAHVILGLPDETHDQMMETAERLAELKVDAVKLHLLCVMKNTALERIYHAGKYAPLERDEYIGLVCDFLERLPEKTIIQRLAGNGQRDLRIAPTWLGQKMETLNLIDKEFENRGTWQGYRCAV